jgi:uncharacterized repeat protein (TIGR01451 family)
MGQADAWEVEAVLSVSPEDSVRPSAGVEPGYVQYIGTIPGWEDYTGTYATYTGSFDLHCKMACESTLTITPMGNDECGWMPIEMVDDWEEDGDECYEWAQLPGREINSEYIEPASITVKQTECTVDLGVIKTVDEAYPSAPEQAIEFTIRVENFGECDATNVVVSDVAPEGVVFNFASGPGTFDVDSGTWFVGTVASGAYAQLVITANVESTDPVVNWACVTSADQADVNLANDCDSVTVMLVPDPVTTVDLDLGWNLISLPQIPTHFLPAIFGGEDGNMTAFFEGISLDAVWGYVDADASCATAQTWLQWPATSNVLEQVSDGWGYWINATAGGQTLTFDGVDVLMEPSPGVPPSYNVCEGWNLIGVKSTAPIAAGDYLNSLGTTVSKIYGFAGGAWSILTSADMLQPGFGYWVAVTEDGTIYSGL